MDVAVRRPGSRLALNNISLFGKPQATQSVEGDRNGSRWGDAVEFELLWAGRYLTMIAGGGFELFYP